MRRGSTNVRLQSLDVLLGGRKIANILRSPAHTLIFERDYRATGGSPILSLSFRSAGGELRRDPKPLAGILPVFFANLLPEGKLRDAMERYHQESVRRHNDFDLLAVLGADMSGAVQVLPSDDTLSNEKPKARFSLAGVQMKLSVIKEEGGGLTLPIDGEPGLYIAKFPPATFPGVSENDTPI